MLKYPPCLFNLEQKIINIYETLTVNQSEHCVSVRTQLRKILKVACRPYYLHYLLPTACSQAISSPAAMEEDSVEECLHGTSVVDPLVPEQTSDRAILDFGSRPCHTRL